MYRTLSALLALALVLGGCAERYKTKEDRLNEGLRLLKTNNAQGAIVLFKNALEKDQNFFEARFQLAKAYASIGKWDSAEKELEKVLRQNPGSRDVHVEMARVYAQQSKPDEALKEIRDFLGETCDDADVLETAGLAHAVKGEYPAAIAYLRRSLAAKNPKPDTRIVLARVYAMAGDGDAARALIQEILNREPAHRGGLYLLAKMQTQGKDLDAAIRTYDRIGKAYPNDGEALFRKGLLYNEMGKNAEALSVAGQLIEKSPRSPEGYRLKGVTLFSQKNYKDAIVSLQKAVSLQPSVDAYYMLGLCHYSENELEQAMSQLQRALDMDDSFVRARVLASMILLRKNRTDNAIIEIKRALEKDDRNALAHNILGSAYLAKGMYAEGMEELNRATEIDPTLVDVYVKKGLFELSKGHAKDAETELIAAVRSNPELLQTRVLLVSYYMKQGAYDKAADVARQGIRGQASDAILYNTLAEAALRRNRANDAAGFLQKAKESNPAYEATYFNLAAFYLLKGERERAVQELQILAGRAPDNVRALVAIAHLLEAAGKEADALAYYTQADKTGKTEGSIERAKYHARKKDFDAAFKVIGDALKKNPSDIVLHEFQGLSLLAQKRFDEAVRAFEGLEKINPKAGLAYLVTTYVRMNKPDKALDAVRLYMKKAPEDPVLMAEISRIYSLMGKRQEAAENARLIIRKNPEAAIGYLTLARVYQEGKEPDKAIEALKGASRIRDENICIMLADLYFARRDYAAALAESRKAEAIKPGSVPAMFQKASILHAMGKRKEAIDEYQNVLKYSSRHVAALNNLAYLYAENSRDLPAALHLVARAYSIAPGDGYVQDTLGFVLLKSGKVEEGLKTLKSAAETVPNNPSIRYHLALAYKEQGNNALAMENLQKAVGLGDFPEAGDARQLLEKLRKK